jgi:HEPN domain-containing protein
MVDARDESEGWHVHLSVSAQEGGDLLDAARGVAERGASLVVSADSELKELVLFSREKDADRARDAAIDVYQRLRRVAGLDLQPARVVSLERPTRKGRSRRRKHRRDVTLMKEATRVLRSESYFEWAVVLAQTACEVYVRDILERRAAQLGDAAIKEVERLPGTNLANESVRRTFHEMTGYAPPDEDEWWRDYQAHAQRRHRIVHAGARIARQDAEDSIKAAKAMIDFLHWPSMRIDAERK